MRRALIIGAAGLTAAIAALACAETLVRNRASRRQGALSPLVYYRHNRQQRAFVHGADYLDRVHINRYGLRGREIEFRKAPGSTRVLAVGASATFDPCASSDSAAWPARMEHWLNVLAPGRRFQVLNAGVPGYLMLDNIIRLQNELYALAPDVILLYAGHGTAGGSDPAQSPATMGSATPDETPTVTPWGRWLERHSLLYNKIAARAGTLGASRAAPRPGEQRWNDDLDRAATQFHRDLVSFVLIAKSLGAKVMVVELAHAHGQHPPERFTPKDRDVWRNAFSAPAEITLEAFRRFSAVQRQVSDSLGVAFVPTRSLGITGAERYCDNDPIHLNRDGAELLGRKLAESLLATAPPKTDGLTARR
ncbi:MAG: SGNH/GDSL hydrolase family protein [Gemmatimonadaceae bacterium]